jgi:hypothetical protein
MTDIIDTLWIMAVITTMVIVGSILMIARCITYLLED